MDSAHRDLIVIGGSAGALEPLRDLVRDLPTGLPSAVLIVIHIGRHSYLASILDKAARLPVSRPASGEIIKPGHIYVATPENHLLVHDGHILLRRGPRENSARPAIDPLFRSAAASYGSRVIGAILSGALNDGTAGLRAIKRCGGVAVVQDPGDAEVPDMPRSALKHAEVDHCVPASAMAALFEDLIKERAPPTPVIPLHIRLENAIAAQEPMSMNETDQLGERSPFTCPECHGTLWEIADGSLLRYRCQIGHAFTAEAMAAKQAKEVEDLLAELLRSNEQRATLVRRMAEKERQYQRGSLAAQLEARAEEYEEAAGIVRRMLRGSNGGRDVLLPGVEDAADSGV